MSDSEPQEVPVPQPAADEAADTTSFEALQKSVRKHRIWLIVITIALSLLLLLNGCSLVMNFGFGMFAGPRIEEGDIQQTKNQVKDAYGKRLKSVEVRTVKASYEGMPFPYSILEGGLSETLYIEYTLNDSKVVFANVLTEGPMGNDVAASGLLPTKGPLTSRMTAEQLDHFLEAYAKETRDPLGGVMRYGDGLYAMEMGGRTPDEIKVGDKEYATEDLWSATKGLVVSGDKADMDMMGMESSALVFREDPETGEFTCLGTQPPMW